MLLNEPPSASRLSLTHGRTPYSAFWLKPSENKLRWNLALSVPRIKLSAAEAQRAAAALRTYLEDESSIVKTAAMHGLADLTRHDPSLLPEVLDMLRILSRSGTPAMRARGRILLKKLEAPLKRTLPAAISTL